jgi:hypothetical protein
MNVWPRVIVHVTRRPVIVDVSAVMPMVAVVDVMSVISVVATVMVMMPTAVVG